jgi:type II secretion system protein H
MCIGGTPNTAKTTTFTPWEPTGRSATTISPTGIRTQGFTLVEVVLVASTLVILLTVAVPSFVNTAKRLNAEQAAWTLVASLRYAHEHSVTFSHVIGWVWDGERRRAHLEAFDDVEAIGPDDEGVRITDRFSATPPLSSDIMVSLSRAQAPATRVLFFPDGTSEPTELLVRHRGHVYTVTVDGATSRVSLTGSSQESTW